MRVKIRSRRLWLYGGRFTARSRITRRSSWPVRVYLKRWQIEVGIGNVGVYGGWIWLPATSTVLHPSIEPL